MQFAKALYLFPPPFFKGLAMNRRIAALHLARRFPDFDSLAAHMGKRPDTLRKELTGVDGYKWGVDDEELLISLCLAAKVPNHLAPVTAAAVNAGALLIPLPPDQGTNGPTFKCLADAAHEFGLFMASAAESLSDGQVSLTELREVERQFGELVAKGQTCVASMCAMHEAGKPAYLRGAMV
jgi:hypothetical protein